MRIPNTGLPRVKNEFTWRLLVMSVSISLWLLSSSVTLSLNSVRYFCRLAMCAAFCSACAHGQNIFYIMYMSRPGIEPGPPRGEANTLEKRQSNSLLVAIRNIYIWARDHGECLRHNQLFWLSESYKKNLNYTNKNFGKAFSQNLLSVWRIRDVYPGSRILIFTHPGSRISDPGSKNSNKRERWKKICYHTNFTKLNIMLFLKC